jgi:hypothetical protein
MRRITFRCEAGFGSTDYNLCVFQCIEPNSKSPGLKPVLLDRNGLTLSLPAMEPANGYN